MRASDYVSFDHISWCIQDLEDVASDSLSNNRVIILNDKVTLDKVAKFPGDQVSLSYVAAIETTNKFQFLLFDRFLVCSNFSFFLLIFALLFAL